MEELNIYLMANWSYLLIIVFAGWFLIFCEQAEFYALAAVVGFGLLVTKPVFAAIFVISVSITFAWVRFSFKNRNASVRLPEEITNGKKHQLEQKEMYGEKLWVLTEVKK
jgi:hypothetical protein